MARQADDDDDEGFSSNITTQIFISDRRKVEQNDILNFYFPIYFLTNNV